MKKRLKIIRVTTKPMSLSILLKGQLKYMNNFHDMIAISSAGKELMEYEKEEGIKTISLNMTRKITPFKDIISLIKMIKILKKEHPDVVHSHTPKAGVISMLASALCKIPHRLHTVGGLPLMEANGIKRKILLFVEWLTYKCATKIYPNSYGLKKFILKNISIPKNKILVIGSGSSNGIDTDYFNRTKEVEKIALAYKKKFALSKMFSFIFIGRFVKDKGIEELLSVFARLSNKYKDTRLSLLGWEEKDLDPISYKAKKIIVSNKKIINLGFKKDIRSYLAASDCLVLPSYREGFPNVVLQAGSLEVPSIVSDINGCNEIIQNEDNGLLVKPKDEESLYFAMEKILLDKEFCKSLANSARKNIVKKFQKKIFYDKILAQYSKLNNRVFNKH